MCIIIPKKGSVHTVLQVKYTLFKVKVVVRTRAVDIYVRSLHNRKRKYMSFTIMFCMMFTGRKWKYMLFTMVCIWCLIRLSSLLSTEWHVECIQCRTKTSYSKHYDSLTIHHNDADKRFCLVQHQCCFL